MNLQKFRDAEIESETLIYVVLFGMMVIQVSLPLGIYSLVSLCTWSIVISSIVAFFMRMRISVDQNMFIVMALLCVLVMSMLCSSTLSYKGVVAAISFLELPLLISSYPEVRNSEKIRKMVYIVFVLLSVFYIVMSFTNFANIFYSDYGEIQTSFLSLGYNNPNETAMYLFVCMIVNSCLFMESRKLSIRIFSAFLIVSIVDLIWRTLARTSLALCILYYFCIIILLKKKIPSFIHNISFIIPIAFFVVTIVFNEALMNYTLLGDSIETGRMDIYMSFLNDLNVWKILFGSYSVCFENLHNGMLTIFATIGILGTGIYMFFLNAKFRYILTSVDATSAGKHSLLGLYCILIYMSTESAFLVSGGAFAVMVFSIYLLSITDDHVSSKQEIY